jgi:chromosome segregation ATPase
MATTDELERRVRELASDVEGEKAVTRQVYAQSVRNGDQIGALRSEVATARVDIQALTSQTDHVVSEIVQSTALLRSHGLRLESLTRDVGLLRGDITALRRGQEELHVRLDRMDARLDQMDARLDQMDARFDRMDARLDQLQTDMAARFDRLESNVAAILAAVTPRDPV